MDKLTLTQLERLANWERSKKTNDSNIIYIAYLWSMLQGLSEDIAAELQRDYELYLKETEDA